MISLNSLNVELSKKIEQTSADKETIPELFICKPDKKTLPQRPRAAFRSDHLLNRRQHHSLVTLANRKQEHALNLSTTAAGVIIWV